MTIEDRRHYVELFLCLVFVLFDLYFFWPMSHGLAIFFAVIVFAVVILAEAPNRLGMFLSSMLIVCGLLSYWLIPPTETEFHGLISAGSDPSPESLCKESESPDAVTIYFGGNAAVVRKFNRLTIAEIDTHPLLSVDAAANGLTISGDIFSKDGALGHIANNEFTINPNTTFRNERPDRHTLIIRDNFGAERLHLRYMNKKGCQGCRTVLLP